MPAPQDSPAEAPGQDTLGAKVTPFQGEEGEAGELSAPKHNSEEEVVSHDANAIRSTPVESPQNILLMTADVDVVGIDEAQFFDESIVDVCRRLANNGVRVIVAGLDMDYTGKPFGPMPALMATAEYVTKVHAICVRCGNLAHHSHRLTSDEKQVMLGAQDSYEPICRHCFNKLMNGEKA